jgi:hypothetical protein
MTVISTVIIRVVMILCMAGLADSVPGLIAVSESEVLRILLKDGRVKSTFYVTYLPADELQIRRYVSGMGIDTYFRGVRVVAGSAV